MYLYAITDRSELPAPASPGLSETLPFSIPCRDIAAVVSPFPVSEVPATETNLWRHEAVIEALMADRAVLPMRFGTVLAGEPAVQDVLEMHYGDFMAALGRVRGRVELGLRVLWEDDGKWRMEDGAQRAVDGEPPSASGRSYLLARLEEEQQRRARRREAQTLAAEIHASLNPLAVEDTQQVLLTPRLLLTAAYLVDRDQVPAFRRQVNVLAAGYSAFRFLCTGPWPVYSFVMATVPEEIGG